MIALIIWLLPFAEQARIWTIIIITYLVGLSEFSHIIAGSKDDPLYGIMAQQVSIFNFITKFFIPTLMGNILGGVALVAAVNYAQVTYEHIKY